MLKKNDSIQRLRKRLCKWLLYKLTNLLKSTLFSSWYTEADVYS